MPQREIADAARRAPRVRLALGVHHEVEDGRARDRMPALSRMGGLGPPEPRELALEGRDAEGAGAPEGGVDRCPG